MSKKIAAAVCGLIAGLAVCVGASAAPPPGSVYVESSRSYQTTPVYKKDYTGLKKVLFIGDLHTGAQVAHESVSHAMAVLERLGRENGLAIFIRTDTRNITKDEVWGTGDYEKGAKKQNRGHNLDDFDVVVFYTNGDTDTSTKQKEDLLRWVHDEGKGFVGIHSATTTMLNFPPYAEMLGATFDGHPWGYKPARVIVERPDFPGMKGFVANPVVLDEHYQAGPPFSRDNSDVLLRIDPASTDMKAPGVRKDGDIALAWAKRYGKGRVFYASFGQDEALWDDPRVQTMYIEAIKWAAGLGDYQPRPHPLPK